MELHCCDVCDKIKDFPVDFATDFPFTPQALKNFSSEFVQTTGILNISNYEVHHFRSCLENPGSFCFEAVCINELYENLRKTTNYSS